MKKRLSALLESAKHPPGVLWGVSFPYVRALILGLLAAFMSRSGKFIFFAIALGLGAAIVLRDAYSKMYVYDLIKAFSNE